MELFDAIRQGDASQVESLLATDPSLARTRADDGTSAVLWAMYVGRPGIARRLASAVAEPLDIHEAAALDDTDRLDTLLAGDPGLVARRSPDGFTALHQAAFFGAATAAMLLERGSDPDVVADNEMKVRPLHSAAAGGHHGTVVLLLEHGADPNARQRHGWTPIHAAAQHGRPAMVDALLAARADATVTSNDGADAAQVAREAGHLALAERLSVAANLS